jgi:endogenous inhibitor of DNA gyrase (YacG/DUF329 family)
MADNIEVKKYEIAGTRSVPGKSQTLIVCPFCSTQVWAYNWSMAGGGKKCPKCGAIHTWLAGSIKKS